MLNSMQRFKIISHSKSALRFVYLSTLNAETYAVLDLCVLEYFSSFLLSLSVRRSYLFLVRRLQYVLLAKVPCAVCMAELTFHHRGETKQNLPVMHQHFADNALASAPRLLRASALRASSMFSNLLLHLLFVYCSEGLAKKVAQQN